MRRKLKKTLADDPVTVENGTHRQAQCKN